MKTTLDIPESELSEVIKYSKAPTKREAVLTALRFYNQRQRLAILARELEGSFKDFMTQEDLKVMREDQGK
jgi:hypothetical protein